MLLQAINPAALSRYAGHRAVMALKRLLPGRMLDKIYKAELKRASQPQT